MKAQIFTFSPFSMICRGQVRQEAGEFHVLPGRVGRQSKLASNPLPGIPILAPSAQGEELSMHQLCSLKVEA